MKIHLQPNAIKLTLFTLGLTRFFLAITACGQTTDLRTNCWFTTDAGQYARSYTNTATELSGQAVTTWANTNNAQTIPSYCGVQEVYSSSNWIYVRSTGLASYTMGPWYLDAQKTAIFPNLPVDQQVLFRFPRTNSVPTTKTENGGGQIGVFVDGVAMYNSWDAYTWDTTNQMDEQNITGYWNRDAYVNEGVSFDPGNAHQQNTGQYHYHADPLGLRYQLGDHVDYNLTTKTYSEDTNTPTTHSPILAWVADGIPLYGPYGYSNATNANSGIRRMISGYVIRNGEYGTSNLTANGRTTIPQWAVRLADVGSNQPGPNVSTDYPLGRYMEDNDYLGDDINTNTGTNYQQGVDFDLDQYNGRWCVTPEFPHGIYAYFVTINSNGTPVFPYDIGRGYYGDPTGGSVGAIAENVTTNFLGDTNLVSTLSAPAVKSGTVTLTWSALEGGSYTVQCVTNLANSPSWKTIASGVSPNEITGGYTNVTSASEGIYRVGRTSVAAYDGAGATIVTTNTSTVPGGSGNPGQALILTITLPTTPPNPPLSAPVMPTVVLTNTLNMTGINCVDISRPATNIVTAVVAIPSGAAAGSQNVIVNFASMPTYTLSGEFTIN